MQLFYCVSVLDFDVVAAELKAGCADDVFLDQFVVVVVTDFADLVEDHAGFVAGLVALVLALGVGATLVFTRQRKGLHTKREDSGVFIYACSKRL